MNRCNDCNDYHDFKTDNSFVTISVTLAIAPTPETIINDTLTL